MSLGSGVRRVFPLTEEHAILFWSQAAALVNMQTQELLWTLTCPSSIAAITLKDDLFVLASQQRVFLWDMRRDQLIQTFHPLRYLEGDEEEGEKLSKNAFSLLGLLCDIAFSRDGSLMAKAMRRPEAAQLWNVRDGHYLSTLDSEDVDYVPVERSVAISPDGLIVATGDFEGGQVWLWRASDGQLLTRLEKSTSEGGRVEKLVFSPDGNILLYGDATGSDTYPAMHAWETRTWQKSPGKSSDQPESAHSSPGA